MDCCTLQGIKDVHEEEPNAKFYEVTKEEYKNFDEQEIHRGYRLAFHIKIL